MKRTIAIIFFTLINLVELLILGFLAAIYSYFLDIFPWKETDPIALLVLFPLSIVFLVIGILLCLFKIKLPILKTNILTPFCTIAYLMLSLFFIPKYPNFFYITDSLVIVVSFILVLITTIISIKKIRVLK